jgi:hypothetical protein
MLRRLTGLLLLISALNCAAAVSDVAIQNLSQSNAVRTESEAQKRAVASLPVSKSASVQLFGKVLELSKSHIDAGPIKRGEWVWLVSVINAAASDLNPVPDGLVWVRAEDGIVVRLGKAK